MSASKSTYSRQALVQALLKAVPFTGPATIYLSLHTAAPGLTGANEVPSTNAYARTAIAFGAASGGAVASSALVTTPAPTWNPLNFNGVTRDVNLNPLANCTVKLFRASDNVLMQTAISDGGGNYSFQQVGLGEQYYVVAYLPGSPDVAGTTVRTLAGV